MHSGYRIANTEAALFSLNSFSGLNSSTKFQSKPEDSLGKVWQSSVHLFMMEREKLHQTGSICVGQHFAWVYFCRVFCDIPQYHFWKGYEIVSESAFISGGELSKVHGSDTGLPVKDAEALGNLSEADAWCSAPYCWALAPWIQCGSLNPRRGHHSVMSSGQVTSEFQ